MPQRMAGEQIQGQQNNIDQENERTHGHVKMALIPESLNCVFPEKNNEDDGKVEKIAMQILQDKRKLRFAAILPACGLAHRAARWIGEKRAIVGLAVVIAGHAEP